MKQYNKLFAILFAVLGVTTLQAQTDVTSTYMTNAGLTSLDGWTRTDYTDYKTDGDVPVIEFYHTWSWNAGAAIGNSKEFYFKQSVTLPAGEYRLAVNAFYREGNGNGTNTKAYIFAGEQQKYIVGLSAGALDSYSGGNDLYKAANAFSKGAFSNEFDFTVEEKTTLEIGFKGYIDTYCSWCILGPVKLYQYSMADFNAELNAARTKLQGLTGLNTAMENKVSALLSETANVAQTKAAILEATAKANTLYNEAVAMQPAIQEANEAIDVCESMLNNSTADDKTTFSNAISTARTTLANATDAATVVSILSPLNEAKNAYCLVAAPAEGYPFDMTHLVVNPKFDEGTTGWSSNTGAPNNGIATNQGGAITGNYFENWKRESYTGEIYQELTDLPKGKYKLTAAAFRDQLIDGASDGDAVYVFANDVETLVNSATPAFYSVEVSTTTGSLRFGVKSKVAKYRWMGIDNVSLQFIEALDLSEFIAAYNTALEAAKAARDNAEYANITGIERTELLSAIADTPEEEQESLANATIALQSATATFIASKADYDLLVAEKVVAENLGMNETKIAEIINGKTGLAALYDLKEEEYVYVMESFNYPVALSDEWNSTGTNTHAATFYDEHWSGERRPYMNQHDGWGEPKQGYPADSWSIDFDQSVTLPAGEYVFKVAGRKSVDATLELVVTMGETVLGTVNDFPSSNEALGINKAGATSFDANDPAGFAKEGKGYGWQWRYVRFVLDEEATVKVAVHAETNKIYNWVSFGDYTLQMSEDTYLEANKPELDAAIAAAEALVNTLPMGDAEKEALQTALDMTYETGDEMLEKTEALNTAVANAESWVAAYNEAKAPLVAALDRFEEDFNDAQNGALAYMNKNIWPTVIEKVQAAAVAKDATNSYAGFEAATTNLVDALNEAQASITAYAGLKAEINYTEGYTPIKSENIDALAADRQEANSGYNDATITTDRANVLIASLQSYRVQDYAYAKENFTEEVELGDWEGQTATNKGEHWNGNGEATYFDYSRWGEAGVHEATQTITLPAGEYVLMAAGRASDVEGTEAYIKVNDTKANFAIKGSYGRGIAKGGTATFATDSTYARDNVGFGWEYRFIKFTLTEETSVELVAGMTIADSYNPLSWAGVCTPVLYATPIAAAQSNLRSAIEKARAALNAYPIGDKAFQVDANCDAYKALSGEITEAEGVLSSSSIDNLKAAVESLNTAIEGYQSGYVLNAPAEGAAYNIVMDNAGWDYHGKAVTYIANDRNDHGLYNIKYHAAPNANYAQAFTFTAVEGKTNCYTLSMTDVDGNERYVCTGAVYGGNTSQIRTTTEADKALAVKVIATTSDGIHQLYNTEANNYIGGQDAGFYTVNSHTTFRLQEAAKANVTLNLSKVGWATLILPFDAELPEGVKAWSCGEVNGEELTLNEASSIKANTPYLISGNAGTYNFSGYGLADKDSYDDGPFIGTYVDFKTEANSNTYVLQKKTIDGKDDVAFYLVGESAQPTVNPYRIYMLYEGAAGAPRFSFGRGGETTSIDNSQFTIDNEVVIYDIMGRKVNTMEKGKMYIVNGKKVVIR